MCRLLSVLFRPEPFYLKKISIDLTQADSAVVQVHALCWPIQMCTICTQYLFSIFLLELGTCVFATKVDRFCLSCGRLTLLNFLLKKKHIDDFVNHTSLYSLQIFFSQILNILGHLCFAILFTLCLYQMMTSFFFMLCYTIWIWW